MSVIRSRLFAVQEKISLASGVGSARQDRVCLLAVSKGKTVPEIESLLEIGHRYFGENRVQEAKQKFTALRAKYPDLRLHLIGPLQTNKVEEAVRLFDVIETLDRPKLAEALARAIKKYGHAPELYIEVNIGLEPQKSGVTPENVASFLEICRETHGLNVTGLMCIPPQGKNPEPYFLKLRDLATHNALPHISMGMSADFEAAIRCGATEIRLGSALFGPRALDPST